MDSFDRSIGIILDAEGGFTDSTADPGNWTGGRIGVGICKGTKYGISAAAYPTLDIPALALSGAKAIYRHDYWDRMAGDFLPAPLALIALDAAVNNGVHRAAVWLQQAAGASPDGVIGPATLRRVDDKARQQSGASALCIEFLARRLLFMTALPAWRTFGGGWARRLFRLPYDSPAAGP